MRLESRKLSYLALLAVICRDNRRTNNLFDDLLVIFDLAKRISTI